MKKIFALMAVVLAVVSCQKDVDVDVNMGGDVATISVALPADAITRAAAEDTNSAWSGLQNETNESLTVTLYIFDENGKPAVKPYTKTITEGTLAANFDIRLVPDRDYTFVAWAGQNNVNPMFTLNQPSDEDWTITLSDWAAMDESRDAFTGKMIVENFNSAKTIPALELTRPFAKLRVVTTDMEWINNINVTPAYATVTYEVALPETFNAYTQTIGADVIEKKTHNKFEIKDYTKDATGEMTLFTDYILAPASGIVKFTLDVFEDKDCTKPIKSNAFTTDIPVKRNNLTTIKGNVLTDGNNITVEVKPDFANDTEWNPSDDKYDVEVWDGKTIKQPTQDAEGNYLINKPSELAWLAAAVNGTLEVTRGTVAAQDFAGKTFLLMNSIDLNNEAWTPIGNSTNKFKGNFDGQHKTIYNLVVRGGSESYKGLFGFTTDGEIKNLVVENAKVSGRVGVGVIAGSPYTSKFNKITVKGHVEVNGMSYVGGVGGRNAYANWENITVNVDETSYVNANSVENGTAYRTYVGGVVGFNGEGGHSFKNITSNIDVKGSTIDVGGLFGIAHYGNQFENCSCSGNVEIYNAEEAEAAEEIGGIAGVWHNGGQDVVFTNCTFTGNLVTPNITEKVDFYYNGLIGAPYSATGTGKLIIDGVYYVHDAASLKATLEAVAEYPSATVALIRDIESSEIITVSGKATINGNGHTITSSAGRAINVSGATDVTIKNLDIVASGERAINVITDSKNVTIENVTATAANYTVNVAASAPNAVVAIKNSTLNGLCTVNVASAGANVTVDGSTVNCNDNNTTAGESYAALCLNKAAVGAKIIATNSTINVTEGSDSTKGRNGAEDGEVTINGGVEGVEVTKAVITYPGSDYYHGFQTIAAAVEFAKSGDVISLIRNVEQADGVIITDKNITIDLNGKTFTVTEGANTNNRNFKVNGSSKVTIKNGTMIAQGDITSGAYGTLRTEGTANVTLEDVKLYSYRGNGFNVKVRTGTTVIIKNSEIYSQYSGGVEAEGGEVVLNNVKIEQNGVYSNAAWNSVAIGVNSKGKVTVNSGNYSASAISTDANAAKATWVAYVMSSGGTLDIKGGTFNGVVAETAVAANACGLICADRAAVVEIHGGTFNSNGAILDMRNNVGTLPNPKATLFGGTFSADPRVSGLYSSNLIAVAAGYKVVEDNGVWTVTKE